MAFLLVLAVIFVQHNKIPVYYIFCIFAACIGYLTIILSPAESTNVSKLDVSALCLGFLRSINALEKAMPLLIAFMVLLTVSYNQKVKRERIIVSLVFFLGALFSNFIMTAASYYAGRALLSVTVLLIISDAILAAELYESKMHKISASLFSVLFLYFALLLPVAVHDIYVTTSAMEKNEAYIIQCRDNGQMDITIPNVYPFTGYSASYGLVYITDADPALWPNSYMADYYGVDSIIGFNYPVDFNYLNVF